MLRWGRVAIAYLAASASAVAVALLWRKSSPFSYGEPWLVLPTPLDHVYSLVIGLTLGGLVAFSTRIFVTRWRPMGSRSPPSVDRGAVRSAEGKIGATS